MPEKKKVGLQPGHWGPQHGPPSNIKKDKLYPAMKPGLRVSRFGNEYYEYRINRSDKNPKKKL